MGFYSNYALIFAQLIIPEDGDMTNCGIFPFLVPMRDRDTHKHLPGIKSGDMGPKFGYTSSENGWLTMENVRIPRDHML